MHSDSSPVHSSADGRHGLGGAMPWSGEWVHDTAVSVLGRSNRGDRSPEATNGLAVALHGGG